MRYLRGLFGAAAYYLASVLTVVVNTGDYISVGGKKFFFFTTALAVGDSAVTLAGAAVTAGSFAFTTHATGRGQIFISDGTNWQDYNEVFVSTSIATITTTGAISAFLTAPVTGKLLAAGASFTDALTANNSNYSTQTLTNLSNAATAMLAATDANTTKATGGTGFAANTARYNTLHGTAANLNVTRGDRLQYTFTATGTLNNTLTNGQVFAVFARTV